MSTPPDRNEFEQDDPREQLPEDDPLDFLRASLFGEGEEDAEGEPPPAVTDDSDSPAGGDEPAPSSALEADDFPDWLAGAASVSTLAAEEDDLPDWMAGFEPSEEAAPSPAPAEPPAPSDDLPDWMAGFEPPTSPPEPSPPAPAQGQDDDLPDWLRGAQSPPAESEAPAPPTTFGPGAGEMPDWLQAAQPAAAPPEPSGGVEVPDWLNAAAAPSPPASSAQDEAIPDWLGGSGAPPTPPETPASAPAEPAAPSADLPDWMADLGLEETADTPSAAEPAATDLPDWMADVGAPAPEEPPTTAEPAAPSADLPDWMADLGLEETADTPSAAEPAAPDLPDWMADVGAPEPEEPQATAEPAAPSVDLPGWMTDFEPPSADSSAPETRSEFGGADEGLPDWIQSLEPPRPEPEPPSGELSGVLASLQFEGQETPAGPPEGEPSPPPEAAEDSPSWLEGIVPGAGEMPASPPEQAAPPAEQPEAGDWITSLGLGELGQAPPSEPAGDLPTPSLEELAPAAPEGETPVETPLPEEPAPTAPEGETPAETPLPEEAAPAPPASEDDDLMALFEGFDLETVEAAEPLPLEDDSTGLDAIFAESPEPSGLQPEGEDEGEGEEGEGEAVRTGELPEWLRKVPGSEPGGPAAEKPLEETLSPDEIGQLTDLRFEAIVEDAGSQADRPETIGALKDVTGMIQPELLFEGESLAADERVDEIIITKDQANRIGLLEVMLAEEAVEEPIASHQKPSTPLVAWVTTAAMLVAVVLPVVLGVNVLPAPMPGPGPIAAHEQVEALPPGATVIAAFEYEPDTAAEMDPLAGVLLEHLARREATVYVISTRPTGPAMALRATQAAAYPAASLVNLGYVPGKANGIREIAVGSSTSFSPLAYDSLGQATNLGASRLQDLQPDLVIVLASHPEEVRAWVEQAGSSIDAPMLAAVGLSAGPLVYPYYQSGQLAAVLSGLNDAVAYHALLDSAPSDVLVSTWNAQAIGGLIAALAIAVGMLLYGLRELRLQQERES